MQYFKAIAILSLCTSILACEKNDPPPIDPPPPAPTFNAALTLAKCTGLNFTDAQGQAIGQVGNPNIKVSPTSPYPPYPNPAKDVIALYTEDEIAAVYFLKAFADTSSSYTQIDFESLLTANPFDLDSILLQEDFNIPLLPDNAYNFNVQSLEAGYYRMFMELTNDSIYCENVYIDPNTWPNESYTKILDDWN